MIVCKFGGKATADKQAIKNIASLNNNERTIWVFSAIGKENDKDKKLTDLLIAYTHKNTNKNKIKKCIAEKLQRLCHNTNVKLNINEIIEHYCKKFDQDNDKDFFISRGEFLTSMIMSKYLKIKLIPAENVIFFEKNKINYKKTEKNLKKYVLKYKKIIIPGFYACYEEYFIDNKNIFQQESVTKNIKTNVKKLKLFRRGGSDLTGSIIAKCLGVNIYENWTDVNGVFPINPNICKTKSFDELSYANLDIMTQYDAKVIHKDCAKLLNGTGTVLIVKNILNLAKPGTKISSFCDTKQNFLVCKNGKENCKLMLSLKDKIKIGLSCSKCDFNLALNSLKIIKNRLSKS